MATQQPADHIWIPGGWVPRAPTLPLEGGMLGIVRFAERAWTKCLDVQLSALEADRKLAIAEDSLRRLSSRKLNKDVAIALAAVQNARSGLR